MVENRTHEHVTAVHKGRGLRNASESGHIFFTYVAELNALSKPIEFEGFEIQTFTIATKFVVILNPSNSMGSERRTANFFGNQPRNFSAINITGSEPLRLQICPLNTLNRPSFSMRSASWR